MTTEHFRSKGYMNFLIIFMGFVALVDQYLSLIEASIITYILDDFDITLSEFTLWQGIVGIFAFFVFLVSWLGDHYGRKIGIFILILIMSVPAVLIGLIGPLSFAIFIILYGIMIMGTNVNFWAVPISEESPANKRGKYGSLVFLIGLIPLYALLGVKIAENLGWQWAYGLMGIFGLIILGLLYFFKETKRWEDNQEEYKQSKKTFLKSMKLFSRDDWKFIGIFGFIYICWSTGFKFATVTMASYYIDVQGKTEDDWSSILTIAGGLTIVGALTIGFIMERFGRIPAFVWSMGGSVLSYLGLGLTGAPGFAMAIYFFMSSALGFLLVYNAERLPTKIRATGIGVLSTLSRVGFVLGPLLISVILPNEEATSASLDSYNKLYLIGAAIMVLPFFTLLFNREETKGRTLEDIAE